MSILLTFVVMYGITFGIKDAKLFSTPRNWIVAHSKFFATLLGCAYCVGFHSGWMTYFLMVPLLPDLTSVIRGLIIYSFAGVTVSGALDAALIRLEGDGS